MTHHLHHQNRWHSLDALRGITIAGMILVNNPGDWAHTFAPLKHADWDGLTIADLVFPFFLFIMGVGLWLSIRKQVHHGKSSKELMRKAAIRSAKLFAIGLALNLLWNAHLDSFRILGVLQRIALVNLAVTTAILYAKPRHWLYYSLVACLGLMMVTNWPVQPTEGSVYAWLDNLVLGLHIYQPLQMHEPEGILSTLTAISTGLAGAWIGQVYQHWGSRGLYSLVPYALLIVAISIVLHVVGLSPINKKIWSASFVLITASMATLLLSLLRWAEQEGRWSIIWNLFRPVGTNPIVIYVGAEVTEHLWQWRVGGTRLYRYVVEAMGQVSPFLYINSLLWSLMLVAFWLWVGHWLSVRKVVVKL